MSKTYGVTIPICGVAYVEVTADSEEAAIQEAIDKVTLDDVNEWEAMRFVVQGNVFYGPQSRAEVELVNEDGE